MISIPDRQSKKWSQVNSSDLFGTLAQTKNITLDKPGYLTLSKRARNIYDVDNDSNFGQVLACQYYDKYPDVYIVVTSDHIYKISSDLRTITEDATANVPTVGPTTDIVTWRNFLYCSGNAELKRLVGSAWSVSLAAIGSSGGPMCVFKNLNRLALGRQNTVLTYTTAHAASTTLTLPDEFYVTSLDWANNNLYIGTRHDDYGEAMMFVWDGATTAANAGYPVGTTRIDSVKKYKNTVVIVTGEGQLLEFNGGGFNVLGNLPVYYTDADYPAKATTSNGKVLHRGMIVDNELIYINLVSNLEAPAGDETATKFTNNFPSGVWCYDPEVGLYHKHSVSGDRRSYTNAVTTANVSTTTGVITVGGATVPDTGTPVLYDDGANGVGTALAPLKMRKKYYVINQSSSSMKLATTYANAIAGTSITLTGTGNNAQFFMFLPNRDFGANYSTSNGAIGMIRKGSVSGSVHSDGMRLMFGGSVGKTSTTEKKVLNVIADTQENRGYAIFPKVSSSALKENWQNIGIKFKGIKTPEDKILLKYRIVEREDKLKQLSTSLTMTGTWTDSDTFTTTYDLSLAKTGDEVEIQSGSGAGYLAHISSISANGGTYTVNLDESVQNVTAADTMNFTIDTWQRISSLSSSQITTDDADVFTNANGDTYYGDGGIKVFPITVGGKWLQLKAELRGEDVAIEEVLINNRPLRELI